MPQQKHDDFTIVDLLKLLKLKYIDGQGANDRVQSRFGFLPTKNAATNFGALMSNSPVDKSMLIRKGDPADQLRQMTRSIGQIERINNVYIPSRVKLAD